MFENYIKFISGLLFIFPATMLVLWGSYTIINYIFIVIGIWVLISKHSNLISGTASTGGKSLATIFFLYALIGVGLNLYHHESIKLYGEYLPFLLMPAAYWAIVVSSANPWPLWLGSAVGGILSFFFSLYQVYFLRNARAFGHIDSIQYGNAGILLATASLVGLLHMKNYQYQNKKELLIILFGILGGLGTSFLSGSKGGWLSILIVLIVMYRLLATEWQPIKRRAISMLVIIGLMFIFLIPGSLVNSRMHDAYVDFTLWRDTGSAKGGSVGPRLELWRFGLSVAGEKPLIGFGHNGFMERKDQAVKAGLFDPQIVGYAGLHNQFLHNYVVNGIVGLFNLCGLFIFIFILFSRYKNKNTPFVRELALMGMLVVVLNIEFGMSNALFPLNAVRQIFLFWIVALFALIQVQIRKSEIN